MIDEITCPLSSYIMSDPVIAKNGYSYENQVFKSYIDDIINNGLLFESPVTGEEISPKYSKNVALKNYIDNLIIKYPLLENNQYVPDRNYEKKRKEKQEKLKEEEEKRNEERRRKKEKREKEERQKRIEEGFRRNSIDLRIDRDYHEIYYGKNSNHKIRKEIERIVEMEVDKEYLESEIELERRFQRDMQRNGGIINRPPQFRNSKEMEIWEMENAFGEIL